MSLNSAVTAAGRVLGPLCAGALIASAGIGWCFIANAVSYLAALTGLLLMRRGELYITEAATGPGAVRAGLRYAWSVPELRIALSLTGVVATFGFNHQVLIPLLADQTFDGGVGAYTLLYTAMMVGAEWWAAVRRRIGVGRVIATGALSVLEPTVGPMRSAGRLVVDPRIHAGEIVRFARHVVCGPTASDCDIWTGAIGADGYGRNRAEQNPAFRGQKPSTAKAKSSVSAASCAAWARP